MSQIPTRPQLPPLTHLPEPARQPARAAEVDYPEEVLFASREEFRRRAGWEPYVWMVVAGACTWSGIALVYVASLSPLTPLFALLSITDPLIMLSAWQGMGLSPLLIVAILVGSPIFGALAGAAGVPAALWWIGRMRPRQFLEERSFQAARNRAFGWALAVPQCALIVVLALVAMVPGVGQWQQLSYSALAAVLAMCVIAAVSVWCGRAIGARVNIGGLPKVAELEQRAIHEPRASERQRLYGILHAQDRRHLPRNRMFVNPRLLVTSMWVIARGHWWVLVGGALLASPMLWLIDVIQAFQAMPLALASGTPTAADPQVTPDVSVLEASLAVLIVLAWCMIAALAPLLAMIIVPIARNQPSDLRTYRTVSERFQVNPWERKVVMLATGIMVVAEIGLIGVFAAVLAGARALSIGSTLAIMMTVVIVPLSGYATRRALAEHLRTIVYGPAHWFMRRSTPIAAMHPARGERDDMHADPRVRERRAREHAQSFGLSPNASPLEVAKAAASTGALPDLGVRDDPYTQFTVEPRALPDHHIPERVEDLGYQPHPWNR